MFLHSFLKIEIFLLIHWIKHWSYSRLGAEPLLLTLPSRTKSSHMQAIREKDLNFLMTQGSMPSIDTWTEHLCHVLWECLLFSSAESNPN